ncbi:MAG: hypothetical protein H6657_01880 [Ardenticatenaceae bacterium]|nr:hypothetical protein [Ardenticatenaceae bacterium]
MTGFVTQARATVGLYANLLRNPQLVILDEHHRLDPATLEQLERAIDALLDSHPPSSSPTACTMQRADDI